jgi:hypothetical protein
MTHLGTLRMGPACLCNRSQDLCQLLALGLALPAVRWPGSLVIGRFRIIDPASAPLKRFRRLSGSMKRPFRAATRGCWPVRDGAGHARTVLPRWELSNGSGLRLQPICSCLGLIFPSAIPRAGWRILMRWIGPPTRWRLSLSPQTICVAPRALRLLIGAVPSTFRRLIAVRFAPRARRRLSVN